MPCVKCLTGWMLESLLELRHSNGIPLISVYGPTDMTMRGGTLTLNFYDPDGKMIDHRRIELLAADARICLRTGCFCNPGADEIAHGLSKEELEQGFQNEERMTYDQFLDVIERIGGKSAGAVRISLGMVSNLDDVGAVIDFARNLLDKKASTL